jgi:hypothetical protein
LDDVGHQILRRGPGAAWRMVGTYTESLDPAAVWTMQIHSYLGRPRAYVIAPGRRSASDTRIAF